MVIIDGYTSASDGWLVDRDRPVHDLSRKKKETKFFLIKIVEGGEFLKEKDFLEGYKYI